VDVDDVGGMCNASAAAASTAAAAAAAAAGVNSVLERI